jgi:hypothetical protein
MSLSFIRVVYNADAHPCVTWSGIQCSDNEQFSVFLKSNVSNRLNDSEGTNESATI